MEKNWLKEIIRTLNISDLSLPLKEAPRQIVSLKNNNKKSLIHFIKFC